MEQSEIRPEVLQRFPWLPSLESVYSNLASKDPVEFVSDVFSKPSKEELIERIEEFFKAAFDNLEYFSYYKLDDLNIYMYLILKILLYIMDDRRITNKVANLYSKITYQDLFEEIENDEFFHLFVILQDLGIDFIYTEKEEVYRIDLVGQFKDMYKTKFRIHFVDYLKLASSLRDEYRKLVNNAIKKGYVFIEERSVARLIQEHIRTKFTKIDDQNKENLLEFKRALMKISGFNRLYSSLLEQWEEKKSDFDYDFQISYERGKDISSDFPPCVRSILDKAMEGQNLIHNERLFLVFFLHALEYPTEKIVDVFSTMPDFDREKTRYQVEFAEKKDYTPHSCETLKSLRLCKAKEYKDEVCLEGYYSQKDEKQKRISHPLFYVQLKQFRSQKNRAKTEKKLGGKKE